MECECDTAVINTVVKLRAHSERGVKFFAIHPLKYCFGLRGYAIDAEEIELARERSPATLKFRDIFVDVTESLRPAAARYSLAYPCWKPLLMTPPSTFGDRLG